MMFACEIPDMKIKFYSRELQQKPRQAKMVLLWLELYRVQQSKQCPLCKQNEQECCSEIAMSDLYMLIIWVVITVVFHFISEIVNKTSILDLKIIRCEVYWGCGFKGQREINIACNHKNIQYLTIQ